MGFTEYSLRYGAYIADDEHERLFAALVELRSPRGTELAAGEVARVLTSFSALLCRHFSSEEALLAKLDENGFEYEWHCRDHNALLAKITELHAGIITGDACTAARAADLITGWLTEHGLTYDNRMLGLLDVAEEQSSSMREIACRPMIAMMH